MNNYLFLIRKINTITSVIASVMKWPQHNKAYLPYNLHIKSECHIDRYCGIANKSPFVATSFQLKQLGLNEK